MSATNSRAAAIRVFGLSDEDLEAWRSSGLGDWLIDPNANRHPRGQPHFNTGTICAVAGR